jgi:hypothetical protein
MYKPWNGFKIALTAMAVSSFIFEVIRYAKKTGPTENTGKNKKT